MRLPIRQPKAASILTLPDLAGGLNLRDGGSEILDNQLTECENMWWYCGALKTRPGIKLFDERIKYVIGPADTSVIAKNFSDIRTVIDGEAYFLQVAHTSYQLDGYSDYLKFFWCGENNHIELGEITVSTKPVNYFVFLKKKTLYCFTCDKKIYKRDISNTDSQWEEAVQEDYYVPLVATYCNCNGKTSMKPEEVLASGTAIEGFNLLSDYYKLEYNAYNPEADNESGDGHVMIYGLLKSCHEERYVGKYVTAKYTDENGKTYTHKVKITSEATSEEAKPLEDGLRMRVFANQVTFYEEDTTKQAYITNKNVMKNNLEIEAPYIPDDSEKEKIFNMRRCEWFGGASEGIAGGTRLFLCGNESEPSLVMWSGLNNLLYFPENSYFYVGDDTSKVTGFGKQSDMLVIFKEKETWYTRYAQNTDITAQDLVNQSVVDYTASAVYFPLTQINSCIGCGYPETIQLCRNRLVWLGNDEKLYTLVGDNQYNERNIFCVSEMVEARLRKSVLDSNLTSCDWNGYYCLCLGNEIYLMDYNCYGYTHVSSYSKTEDANIRIPWYYWKLPESSNIGESYNIGALNDKMFLTYFDNINHENKYILTGVLSEENTSYDNVYYITDLTAGAEGMRITERPIKSVMQTKIFDFGIPHVKKNIEQINLQFTEGGSKRIALTTITNIGTNEDTVSILNDKSSKTAGFVESCAVFPCIKQIIRFGLKLECDGPFAIDSIVLKYRTLGGSR